MKHLLVLFSLVFATMTHAGTLAQENAAQFGLNQSSPNGLSTYQLGTMVVKNRLVSKRMVYDFVKQGGAQTAISLLDPITLKPVVLPQGAIIRDCLIDVVTAPAGSGASIAIGTGQSATDLKAATVVASYTGLVACVPVGSAATSIKLTADRSPAITVSGGTLTQGKINVFVDYELSL